MDLFASVYPCGDVEMLQARKVKMSMDRVSLSSLTVCLELVTRSSMPKVQRT